MGEFIHVRLLISSRGKVAEAARVTCFIISKWHRRFSPEA